MNYWAWGGKYIGERSGDYLYSHTGKPLGHFSGEEIYDFEGKYIGEVRDEKYLIVDCMKKSKRGFSCCEPTAHCGSSYMDYCGYVMYAGYEDFVAKK